MTAVNGAGPADRELKQKHRRMWASGDYPAMVETFLLPLGRHLVRSAGISPGQRVLDVAAGTGNASLPAAAAGAEVTASDLTPELLEAGRHRAEAEDLDLEWVEADAEHLPFRTDAYDVVMSSIGIMFAPHHQQAADEVVRVCRPGGTVALLSWTPEGMVGALLRTLKPFVPQPPPGTQPAPLWGTAEHQRELFGERVGFHSTGTDVLGVTAFHRPQDLATHIAEFYGPTLVARDHAGREGRTEEFDAALRELMETWNRGTAEEARFEMEYLLTVGTLA